MHNFLYFLTWWTTNKYGENLTYPLLKSLIWHSQFMHIAALCGLLADRSLIKPTTVLSILIHVLNSDTTYPFQVLCRDPFQQSYLHLMHHINPNYTFSMTVCINYNKPSFIAYFPCKYVPHKRHTVVISMSYACSILTLIMVLWLAWWMHNHPTNYTTTNKKYYKLCSKCQPSLFHYHSQQVYN